jgi:hypothetical protein
MVPAAAVRSLRSRLIDLVGERRAEGSETVRSVLRATVDQAGQVVSHAESRAEEVGSWNSRLDAVLSPDLERLVISIGEHHQPFIDLDALISIDGTRRGRVRRFLNRNGPSAPQTSESVRRIGNLVTGRVDADLRRGLAEVGRPRTLSTVPMATHRAISGAVHNWLVSVEDSVAGLRPPFRDPAVLLLLGFVLDGRSIWGDALEIVAPSLNGYALRTGARWRLEADLSPIYEALRLRLRESTGARASSSEEIRLAEAAAYALTARKSLANV